MHDETKAVKILENQFKTCQKANGQFCNLNTPFLLFANPPTCISALYAKDKASIKKRCSLQIRKARSVSILTSITPNVWILRSPTAAVPLRNHTHLLMEKHLDQSYHRHSSMYFDYNQHAVLYLNISTYHHTMKPMNLLSTYPWTQPISMQ